MPTDFQVAYERARRRFEEAVWLRLTPHEQTEAIYAELRALDAERAARNSERPPDTPTES